MTSNVPRGHDLAVLTTPQLELLFRALARHGYDLIGPTIPEGAIVYDLVASTQHLPVGWTDEEQGGKYHLKRREDAAYFGYNLGPHAWKKFLRPPSALLWRAQRSNGHFQILSLELDPPRYAFVGVRACELQALNIQDALFLGGPYPDVVYQSRRACQNLKTIEDDLSEFISTRLHLPDDRLQGLSEQAIRNCDPCIFRATDRLKVRVERL